MTSSRQLKNKIQAVGNIGQITRAMEMVAAVKMRKSQEVALRARPFAKKALNLLSRLSAAQEFADKGIFWQASPHDSRQRVWREAKPGKTCLIVVTSDKGLAGSFNSQVLRLALQWMAKEENVEVVAVGRKARDYFRARGIVLAAEFFSFSDILTLADVAPLADWVLSAFGQEKYARVMIVSTKFISALNQKPEVRQVLPFDMEELTEVVQGIVPKGGRYAELQEKEQKENVPVSLLEPSPESIFELLARDLAQVAILHFVFESNASEHSARMVAMKNATENAQDLKEELELALNKARQGAITQELAEIATAKEALSKE